MAANFCYVRHLCGGTEENPLLSHDSWPSCQE